jgi:uncharacterized protein YndB with AHSA1/START domain
MNTPEAGDTIVKEISIAAPAAAVFEALADPAQRVQWWGVAGRFRATHMESDLRAGGAWVMRGTAGNGRPFVLSGEYRNIERPRLLEFTWLPDWEANATPSLVRFELEEEGGVTLVRLTHSGLTSASAREQHRGWPGLLTLLRTYVQGEG